MSELFQIDMAKEIEFDHMLSFRKELKQSQVEKEVEKLLEMIKINNLNIKGPVISATYSLQPNEEASEQTMDFEVLIPVDRETNISGSYRYLPKFKITNALFCKYTGDPQKIDQVYLKITEYIESNNLHPITTFYNITKQEKNENDQNVTVIEIYIGLNPNIL